MTYAKVEGLTTNRIKENRPRKNAGMDSLTHPSNGGRKLGEINTRKSRYTVQVRWTFKCF